MATSLTEFITTEDQLREVVPPPRAPHAWAKTIDHIDSYISDFIGRSPFALLATCDKAGHMDISPKGDPPGFVRVLDEKTLAIPDRPGNGRADSFRNIVENPRIGVYFLVPGRQETLRVSGGARLARDAWLLEEMAVKGKPAQLAVIVDVEEAFFHCAKCVVRSHLWDAEQWLDSADLPSVARALISEARIEASEETVTAALQKDIETRLY
jgi:uncharacterized protein